MAETAKVSKLGRLGWAVGAAVLGYFASQISLDMSLETGHWWPIHLVSGPVFWPASLSHDDQYAVLLMAGTSLLFALYAWCATTFRTWMVPAAIAVVHFGFGAGNIVMNGR